MRCEGATSCSGKEISITDSERVFVALGIQHAMHMRHILVCGPLSNTIFFHITLLTADFLRNYVLNISCVLCSIQLLSETFLILRRFERDMVKNVHWSSCKIPFFLSDFKKTWIF